MIKKSKNNKDPMILQTTRSCSLLELVTFQSHQNPRLYPETVTLIQVQFVFERYKIITNPSIFKDYN